MIAARSILDAHDENAEVLALFRSLHSKRINFLRAGGSPHETPSVSVSVAKYPRLARQRYHWLKVAGFELRWIA